MLPRMCICNGCICSLYAFERSAALNEFLLMSQELNCHKVPGEAAAHRATRLQPCSALPCPALPCYTTHD